MGSDLSTWLIIAVRWTHIVASILWVGTTYYFTWLDGRFAALERGGEPGQARSPVWMVHSGGFYRVEKTQAYDLAHPLHWFRWEAGVTWLSGLTLLILVYWAGGAMIDTSVAAISDRQATIIGAGALVLGWFVYDLMVRSPLARSERLFAAVGFLLIGLLAWVLERSLSGRAVYIHVGALFGTIMAGNVWMRILPAQARMVAAVRDGRTPDAALAASAKLRSKQNTFLSIPVVFLMMSNHFPVATYGSRYALAVLLAMVLLGWIAAALIRRS